MRRSPALPELRIETVDVKRMFLFTSGWIAACGALYLSLLLLDVYWNLVHWRFHWDADALALVAWMLVSLILIWFLAGVTRGASQNFALVLCVAIFGIGLYTCRGEPLSTGLFERLAPSPIWYRGSRTLVMSLPLAFWVTRWRRRSKESRKGNTPA